MFMIGVLGMVLFAATDGAFAFFVQKFMDMAIASWTAILTCCG